MTLRTGHRNSTRRGDAGFTLMELVLVLVVITVVLAMAAPSLRGFLASRQTSDAAMNVLALTKAARSQAVSQGQLCRLNVDGDAGKYWLTVQQAGAFVALEGQAGQTFEVPKGSSIRIASEANVGVAPKPNALAAADAANAVVPYVQFYPSGRSDPAVIELRGEAGEAFDVTCESVTEPFQVSAPKGS